MTGECPACRAAGSIGIVCARCKKATIMPVNHTLSHQVWASQDLKINGVGFSTPVLLAAFLMRIDADTWADEVSRLHSEFKVEVRTL